MVMVRVIRCYTSGAVDDANRFHPLPVGAIALDPEGKFGGKGGSSSVAERQLPKLNVAGSIPVSRSIDSCIEALFRLARQTHFQPFATYRHRICFSPKRAALFMPLKEFYEHI